MTTKKIYGILFFFVLIFVIPAFFPIHADDLLNVTATVQPDENDITIDPTSLPTSGSLLKEDDMVEIKINYRSNINIHIPVTLKATWQKGLIENSNFNYIDVFDYVIGSATVSPEGVYPIIDLQNNVTSWKLTQLNQSLTPSTVSFKLKVKSELLTLKKLSTIITVGASIGDRTVPDQLFNYSIKATSNPSPSQTPTPTSSPSVKTTSTPTPTVALVSKKPLLLESIHVFNISDTSASIHFSTSKEIKYVLKYGKKSNNLNKKITSINLLQNNFADIPSLEANTQYYFSLELSNNNEQVSTDIFTFKTASKGTNIALQDEDVSLTANELPLTATGIKSIIIPVKQPFSITIKLDNADTISEVTGKFVNAKILGINVFAQEAPEEETKFIELFPGVFSAQLQAPARESHYYLELQIKDKYGGFYTKSLPYRINVSPPIRVVNSITHNPIENASVYIQKYDSSKKKFVPLANSIVYNNSTDQDGQINITLPPGEYLFRVKTLGFNTLNQQINIGISTEKYPELHISPSNNIIDIGLSYIDSVIEVWKYFNKTANNFFTSPLALRMIVGVDLLIDLGLYIAIMIIKRKFNKIQSFTRFQWIRRNIFLSIVNSIILYSLIIALLFIFSMKIVLILPLIVLSIAMLIFWLLFIDLEWKIVQDYYSKKIFER